MSQPKIAQAAVDPKTTHSMSKREFGSEHMLHKKRTQHLEPCEQVNLKYKHQPRKHKKAFQI